MIAPLPSNETERLAALQRYDILDTEPEKAFDDITLLASQICRTEIATITLVDRDRQWFKSKVGTTESERSRDVSFCAHGILESELVVVENALADDRFSTNPLVTGDPKIRFYAGAPLITSDGYALGMLCVFATAVRTLSQEQRLGLKALGRHVVAQLELRRSMADLAVARDAALKAARAKSQFLANMSHDIRTSMNVVVGMAEVLLDRELEPQKRGFAEEIRAAGQTLLTNIIEILDFAKVEAVRPTIELRDFDLCETVEEILHLLAEAAHRKGIELICEFTSNIPARLRGDSGRLQEILTNILGNAIKFTEKGEVVVRVSVARESETHNAVQIDIEDTGIGISAEAQIGLFQPFNQADGSTAREYRGIGLGLAGSKELAAIMGGEIGVTSEKGKGSRFWFTVILERQPSPGMVRQTNVKILGLRVLIVDDNAKNRQILRRQLLTWKMEPTCATGGREALESMRNAAAAGKPYDLVLLDMEMPEMDGLTLARAIKSDPTISSSRLVTLMSHGQHLATTELQKFGIESCLLKPVKQSRLFDSISGAMDQTARTSLSLSRSSKGVASIQIQKTKETSVLPND